MSLNGPIKLAIRNPSDYARGGFVVTDWLPIRTASGISPTQLVATDENGRELAVQVDEIQPGDPGRASLALRLESEVRPGREDYGGTPSALVTLRSGSPTTRPPAALVKAEPTGLRLTNTRLDVFVSFGEHERREWFAGAASSVVVDVRDQPHMLRDRLEILDAYRGRIGAVGHDPEKRCMQIDRLRLALPSAEEVDCFSRPYRLVASSAGAVRATATLATDAFDFPYVDPVTGLPVDMRCRLFRVFSLYGDADYVLEEVYVMGIAGARPARPIHFSARYYADMDMGLFPTITHHGHIPDWFAISCSSAPFQGYGFATDLHSERVQSPHPWVLRDGDERMRTFSWQLGVGDHAHCVHMFRFCDPEQFPSEVGRAWYTHVYKPLKATLE